jgi:NAD(P)-dependent dehydrogenase (short-subunit alcohol dehydrogenase family)
MSVHLGRVYAISGGASGLGLAAAKLLAKSGASVSLSDISESNLVAAAAAIKEQTPDAKVITHALDVRSRPDVQAWITRTVDELGNLHGSVNMAGIMGFPFTTIDELPDERWDRVISTNLTGTMICLSEQIKAMKRVAKERGEDVSAVGGRSIVNAASVVGLIGGGGVSAYSASKHAVIGLSKSAAKEVGLNGIRVNVIAPYVFSLLFFLYHSRCLPFHLHGSFLSYLPTSSLFFCMPASRPPCNCDVGFRLIGNL